MCEFDVKPARCTNVVSTIPATPSDGVAGGTVDAHVAGRVIGTADTGSLRGDLLAVMQAMRGHLTPQFLAMMSGLVHAMRADRQLAASLRSLFEENSVSGQIVDRASWDATIWRRDADGTWRIAVEISTPLPPPLPS